MASEEEVRAVKRAHSARLLETPGVSGVGVERDDAGSYYLAVHVSEEAEEAGDARPSTLDGVPVHYHVSGPFRKLEADAASDAPKPTPRKRPRSRPRKRSD